MKKVIPILLVLLAVGVAGFFGVRYVRQRDAKELPDTAGTVVHIPVTPTRAPTLDEVELPEIQNILLLGVDNDNPNSIEEQANSDGIMLVTIQAKNKELIFTSFLRDTRVRVNDSYYDKLTNVFHEGGVEALYQALDDNFGVRPDYYAQFNYVDVAEIVDAVGGVEVELDPAEIVEMDNKIINICWMLGADYEQNKLSYDDAGPITLNGIQAAAYMRIRPGFGDYDFGRTQRARRVVSTILDKVSKMSRSDMLAFADRFYSKAKTDVPEDLLLVYRMHEDEVRDFARVSDRIPIDGSYESGNTGSGYYVVPDLEVNAIHLRESLYEGKHDNLE